MKKIKFALQIMLCAVIISSCKKEEVKTPVIPEYTVGQEYGGGVVFYVDETGKHGLTAAINNQSTSAKWFNENFIETHASAAKIGTGQENTAAIITSQGAGIYAASICDSLNINGFSDWFLPSKDELHQLYLQKAAGKITGLANNFYWSSTETSSDGAWSQSFTSGANSSAGKDGTYYVCAVRAF